MSHHVTPRKKSLESIVLFKCLTIFVEVTVSNIGNKRTLLKALRRKRMIPAGLVGLYFLTKFYSFLENVYRLWQMSN